MRIRLPQALVVRVWLALGCALLASCGVARRAPNIVLVVADDLGWGELGCQGQRHIRTPRLDALAASGLRYTNYRAGAPVCAPSRCVLLTGLPPGLAQVRDNRERQPEGQLALRADTRTLALALREYGYATACIGKWGLGGPGSSGEPQALGFDHSYGYLCQRHAHDHYPSYLWRDGAREELAGNDGYRLDGAHYAPDLLLDDARAWMREHAGQPFFLYYPSPLPHLALQVPQHELALQPEIDDVPYDGKRGYLAHARPRAAYAAMIERLDRDVGALLDQIDELGLARDTLFVFTSDNGPTHDVGGVDTRYFDSAGGLRGRKGSVYEGGLRAPLLVRWSGHWPAGAVRAEACAAWDLFPTLLEVAGVPADPLLPGLSLAPAHAERLGEPRPLYFEFAGYGGQVALIEGNDKLVWRELVKGGVGPELYDLAADPREQHDLAASEPRRLEELCRRIPGLRVASNEFPLRVLDALSPVSGK